jgi:hypothetical protein
MCIGNNGDLNLCTPEIQNTELSEVLVFILQGLLSFGNGNSGSFYKL